MDLYNLNGSAAGFVNGEKARSPRDRDKKRHILGLSPE